MRKRFWTILVMIVAAVVIGIVFYQDFGEDGPIAEGDEIPDIELPLHDGGNESLHNYAGNIVVLNLWASWCEPCIREMPELMDFAAANADEAVEVITVNMQTREYRANDAIDFINEQDLSLPVLLDTEGVFLERAMPRSLPMTYIIDEDLEVREIKTGEVHAEMLQEMVNQIQ